MRPGDILGALTGDLGFSGEDIGKINIHPTHAYVAVKQSIAKQVWKSLQQGKIKGKISKSQTVLDNLLHITYHFFLFEHKEIT